jgi:hypothetical protein
LTVRPRGDAGQAFPIYIAAVAGLLFLALAFFAVGQAGATRNAGQTAADAAALGAAQEYRDQLRTAFLRAILSGDPWEEILSGRWPDGAVSACAEAQWFAGQNDADTNGRCDGPVGMPPEFTVTVTTRGTVGRSVIPGTEGKHAEATAKAVVDPLCTYQPPGPSATLPAPGGGGGGNHGGKPSIGLVCDGGVITIDPGDLASGGLGLFPDAKDLFGVRLAD